MPKQSHLIGAYGLHWARSEVTWHPGRGTAFQLLGRLNHRRPVLRVCDFKWAAGIYVLERRGHAVYAGLGRGNLGISRRLRAHHNDPTKLWTHFSWFSFDNVSHDEPRVTYTPYPDGWAYTEPRDVLRGTTMLSVVGELEALVVNLMIDRQSVFNIQRPRFPHADHWQQVVAHNYRTPGICHRVARHEFADQTRFDQ